MEIPKLTDEARAEIKLKHPHRFPELRFFPKPGDDGTPVKIPVVLGIPTGAADMPAGDRKGVSWKFTVSAYFSGDKEFDYSPLVNDCVLWPPPAVWAQLGERWPGLSKSIWPALREKIGASLAQLEEPDDEKAPPDAAIAITANPGSSWLRFKSKPKPVEIVIKVPNPHAWALYVAAVRKRGADEWELGVDMVTGCVVHSSTPLAQVIAQYPGVILTLTKHIAYLAGIASEYEEGEL